MPMREKAERAQGRAGRPLPGGGAPARRRSSQCRGMEAVLSLRARAAADGAARLLDGGREVYPAMLEAIRAARAEVFLEV